MELFNLLAPPAVTFVWIILWAMTMWNYSRMTRRYRDTDLKDRVLGIRLRHILYSTHRIMHELQSQIIHIEAIVERSPPPKTEIYEELCDLKKRIGDLEAII